MKKLIATLLVLGACACMAFAAVRVLSADEEGPEPVPTHRVAKQELRREVPADGNLKAVQATPILAPAEARMALKIGWIVEDGARVKDGEVVVRFDPTEMKERLRDGNDSRLQARKRITKEKVTASSSRRRRDRDAQLAEKEMEAARDFQYTEEDDVFSRNEILESKIDSELAEAKLAHARAAEKIERSVSGGKLDVLRVQEKQAAMHVSRAEKALSMLELTAPQAGIVLLHRDWRGRQLAIGDSVWPGQKIAEVPGDATMEAEVYVLEADGGALEVGMKAVVTLEASPGSEYEAEIKQVDKLAQPRNPEVPVQYFKVVLTLAKTDPAMKIGQRVRARVLVEETEAVAVPRQAVFSKGKKFFVYRKSGSEFEKVEVELGAGTAGRVIVSKGLTEGDEIALRDPWSDRDGGPVESKETADAAR